jgi:hypothetical protein
MDGDRVLQELTRAEALHLLGSVPVGRLVFTERALPTVRPVNHIVADSQVIIRPGLGTAVRGLLRSRDGLVVGYQADLIDPAARSGWSVMVVGRAREVTGKTETSRYLRALHPWLAGDGELIAISTELVTGIRLAAVPLSPEVGRAGAC